MRNNIAITIIRWIIAVPAGLLLWFAANYSMGEAFGIIHGVELVDSFWDAPDMNGTPIIGTYILVITRTIAAATLVGTIIYLAPRYHKQVAILSAALLSATAVGIVGWALFQAEQSIGPYGWYKNILDVLSIMFGAIVGAWLAYGNQKRMRRAS
jgi:glucan phosphoethanolaminetransferase (alkaline phosphatase superfamily)